jgi:hypothetical protein
VPAAWLKALGKAKRSCAPTKLGGEGDRRGLTSSRPSTEKALRVKGLGPKAGRNHAAEVSKIFLDIRIGGGNILATQEWVTVQSNLGGM